MKEGRSLQSIIDPFVKRVGGELVSDLIGNKNLLANADYFFRQYNIIAELKSLQAGGFIDSFHRKLGNLVGKWDREGKLRVFGTAKIESNKLPPECRDEMFSVMAESLQKQVVYAANKQIKSTKALLNMPDAKGLLWVASDGNEEFQPNTVWHLLTRILRKKKENGDLAYSSIHGIAYFNPRMLASVSGVSEPALLWFGGARRPNEDGDVLACLRHLSDAWPHYVSWAQGVPIRLLKGKPEDARFLGVEEKLPRIVANYQQPSQKSNEK